LSYSIRPAVPEDAQAITDMRWKLFEETHSTTTPEPPPEFLDACRSAVTDSLAGGHAFAWLAVADRGAVVGNLVLLLHFRLPSPRNMVPTEGYVMNVYVEPAWRRRGIASALMGAALDHARALGLGRVRLHATDDGRQTYARAGFLPREDGMELNLAPVRS